MASEEQKSNGSGMNSWSYEPGEEAMIIIRGSAPQYSVTFLALLQVSVDPEEKNLIDLTLLAEEKGKRVRGFDLTRPPGKIKKELTNLLERITEPGVLKDSSRVRSNFRRIFGQRSVLKELAGKLRREYIFETEEFLRSTIEKDIFTSSDCEMEFRICNWKPPVSESDSKKQNNSAEKQIAEEIEEPVKHLLSVDACVKPVEGKELRYLQLKDDIFVRVIGQSAEKINSALIDDEAPVDNPYSRPIPTPVAAIKVGPGAGKTQFWVKLKQGVFGRGIQPSSTQVRLHETRKDKNPLAVTILYFLTIFATVFFLVIFLIFLNFPDYFFVFL